ncbi:hypothetical protein UO65_2629 [Actinokineospora spheciospongiae]|uniref:DUF8017 domain-containing protein n=1 Tax=Actinokineospora spheciospongiae TaxID=909613 RepID=W7IMK7_9PSEU|nr:hypothetical protein UO65_2629 [Actinokineospora spheciospongiae]
MLGVISIVVIVAAVVTIILVNRSSDPVAGPQTSSAPPATTTGNPAPSSSRSAPTTRAEPTTTAPGDGGTTVDNAAARLAYRVPAGWRADESSTVEVLGVEFSGSATTGPYNCGGADYSRAFAVSAAVQNSNKQTVDPAKAANSFVTAFAEEFYPQGMVVGAPAVETGQLGGKKSVTLTADVGTKPTKPDCEASGAAISVLAVDLDNATADHPSGVALLVVVRDRAGGPTDPAPVPDPVAAGILASAEVD